MNVERIKELTEILCEAKESPEFEAYRTKLQSIFKQTAEYYKKAAKDLADEPEIADSIKKDQQDYERLVRLAKSGKQSEVAKAWKGLDTAPMETVFEFIDKKDRKKFMDMMGTK